MNEIIILCGEPHMPFLNTPDITIQAMQQPLNPSAGQRRVMEMNALLRNRHPEDFPYISSVLAPSPDINNIVAAGSCRGKKVGIIGGGLAGMAAAFELRKAGFDITIFEANSERIGGRIYTYYFDQEKRLYGEFGAMRLPVGHETVWHYIDLFALNTRPFIQTNPAAFIYLQNIRVRNDPDGESVRRYIYPTYAMNPWETAQSWQQLGFYGIEAPVLQAPPCVRREILEVLPAYSPQTLFWDGLDTRQAMERQGLSQGAISLLSNLFPIGGRFLYNNYIDYVQEYFPANFTYMYEISGGMIKLPEALYHSFISRNPGKYYPQVPENKLGSVAWKNGCAVSGIFMDPDTGAVALAYREMGNGRHGFGQFDYVICAVPFSVLRVLDIQPLFSSSKMQAIREVTYSPAQKTLFRCSGRFWEKQGIYGGGSYTDLPSNTTWYPSADIAGDSFAAAPAYPADGRSKRLPGSDSEGVLLASYNFNLDAVRIGNLPDAERFRKLKRDVEEIHGLNPGWLDPVVTQYKTQLWDKDPFFRGAFCYFTPQQKKLFSWTMLQPEYGNRVFFAGEHTSALHRWMQGALKSGMEAANAVAFAAQGSGLCK
jgi:monoamine oxidase